MRQRLAIIITLLVAIGALVLINSAAYVSKDKEADSEFSPYRSTYNGGVTGTRALHDFLNESGYQVMRWREPMEKLLGSSGDKVKTFVIVGRPLIPIEAKEAADLRFWVKNGGRLVIIDRHPESYLLRQNSDWEVTTEIAYFPIAIDSPEKMTEGVEPVRPNQATPLTQNVETVLPSRYASAIKVLAVSKKEKEARRKARQRNTTDEDEEDGDMGPPPPAGPGAANDNVKPQSPAPVVHLSSAQGPLLVDYNLGLGRVIVLSDPFMVANEGIRLRDNLQMTMNILAPAAGLIAFDEFHQAHGATHNAFVSYFEGTPVLAICGQIVLLVLLVLWTQGRRFARPLPLPYVDRRSSLEFVASMAELQQRAHALDLAIENIYSRMRRVLARYAGVDYNSSRKVIAERIASRSTIPAHQLETLMRQSEEAINGEPISERQSVHLIKRLREIEARLGLRMRAREVKQYRTSDDR